MTVWRALLSDLSHEFPHAQFFLCVFSNINSTILYLLFANCFTHRTIHLGVIFLPTHANTLLSLNVAVYTQFIYYQIYTSAVDGRFVIPFRIYMLKPNPQGNDIRRWGFWEVIRARGWSPHDGVSVIKEIPENALSPSTV